MDVSLYEKYGFDVIGEIVHDFYGRVLKSEIAAPYFVNIDMDNLIYHQTQFLCYLVGGPVYYNHDELKKLHERFFITSAAFTEVADLLEETLEDHDLDVDECRLIMNAIYARHNEIVHEKT